MTSPSAGRTIPQAIVLIMVPILAVMGAILMAPLLPRIAGEFGQTPGASVLIPLLMTAPAFCLGILSPAAGRLCDRFGARRVLLGSLLLYAIVGTAPIVLTSLWAILASRLAVGIAEAGLGTASTALLMYHYLGDQRQKWFAYQSMMLPVLITVLIATTGFVGDHSWRLTFLVYLVVSLLMFVAALIWVAEAPAREARTGTIFPPFARIKILLPIAVFGSIAFYLAPVQVGFLLDRIGDGSPGRIGLATALGAILGVLGPAISRRLTRNTFSMNLVLSFGLMGVGLLLMALGTSWGMIAGGVALQQIGGGMMITTGLTYTGSLTNDESRGRFVGAWWFSYMLAQSLAPLIMSGLFAATGDRAMALAIAAVGVLATSLIWWRAADLHRPVVAQN